MLGPYIIPLLEQRKRNWYKHDINWCLSPQLRTRVLKPMFLAVSNLSLGFAKAAASTNPLLIASTSWIHFIPSISSQNPEFDSSLSMFHLYQTFYCQRCWSLNSHNFPHQKSTHTHTHFPPPKKCAFLACRILTMASSTPTCHGFFFTGLFNGFQRVQTAGFPEPLLQLILNTGDSKDFQGPAGNPKTSRTEKRWPMWKNAHQL